MPPHRSIITRGHTMTRALHPPHQRMVIHMPHPPTPGHIMRDPSMDTRPTTRPSDHARGLENVRPNLVRVARPRSMEDRLPRPHRRRWSKVSFRIGLMNQKTRTSPRQSHQKFLVSIAQGKHRVNTTVNPTTTRREGEPPNLPAMKISTRCLPRRGRCLKDPRPRFTRRNDPIVPSSRARLTPLKLFRRHRGVNRVRRWI